MLQRQQWQVVSWGLQCGFLNFAKIGVDGIAGGISAGAGHQLTSFLGRFLNVPSSASAGGMEEIVWILPEEGLIGVRGFSCTLLTMDVSTFEQLAMLLTEMGYEAGSEFLEELLQTGAAEWMEDQLERE